MGLLSQPLDLQLRLVRRSFRRVGILLKYGSFADSPILFANSFPKSGTHLLTQILDGFTKFGPAVNSGLPAIVNFDGPTGKPKPSDLILDEVNRLQGGDIAYGHLHATPAVITGLTLKRAAVFFLYRDPRDVVVSHVHYVTEIENDHVHHHYYSQKLKEFDERLEVSIIGRPNLDIPFPNIRERFNPYLDWLQVPEVCPLRFEDLIEQRRASLEKILEHVVSCGFPLKNTRDESLRILEAAINPEKSPTFRSGTTGKWREVFTEEHKAIFKEIAGGLLIQLGFEESNDW